MPDLFEALAAPARRAILDELTARDNQTLFELVTHLTANHGITLTRQAISQHLGVLEEVGLVTSEKQGRCKFHTLNPAPLAEIAARWLKKAADEHPVRPRRAGRKQGRPSKPASHVVSWGDTCGNLILIAHMK